MGWLNAPVETGDKKSTRQNQSRLDMMMSRGIKTDLPTIHVGFYIWQSLIDCGVYQTRESGAKEPLAWTEILAFSQASGTITENWELRIVRRMSEAYIRGLREGTNALSKHPRER